MFHAGERELSPELQVAFFSCRIRATTGCPGFEGMKTGEKMSFLVSRHAELPARHVVGLRLLIVRTVGTPKIFPSTCGETRLDFLVNVSLQIRMTT